MENSKSIENIFSEFKSKNILILGDVMVDSYLVGNVDRISPEAPVPVVNVQKRFDRLGGAANVALNIRSLGANAFVCALIGKDAKGEAISKMLEEHNICSTYLSKSSERPTTTKFRVIGNNTQMLRVDEEATHPLSDAELKELQDNILKCITQEHIHAIIIEDYDKACIDKRILDFVIEEAQKRNIYTSADPKFNNFPHYTKLNLFKPNLRELSEGLHEPLIAHDFEAIKKAAQQLLERQKFEAILVTLSEFGMMLVDSKQAYHVEAERRNIADVSGAGDTVISTITLALASGLDLKAAVNLANIAGGLVCEEVGVVPIDCDKLKKEFFNLHVKNEL